MKEIPDRPARAATPDALHKAANKARIEHPYREVERHTNPYTGELIFDMASYERYIREHAYYDLCDQQIELNDKKNQKELDFLHANLAAVQKKASAADRYRRNSKRLLWFFLASILSIVIIIVVANRKIDNAFSKGHSSGYMQGYDDGCSDGYESGYASGKSDAERNTAANDTSRSVSSSPTRSISNIGTGSTRAAPIADTYIGNKNTHKYHLPTCSYLPDQVNQVLFDSAAEAEASGYSPCGKCNP